MNRRASIKSILAAGFLGTSIYSGCRWSATHSQIELKSLYLHKDLIAELAETIIPATDTPGAKDAKVEDFIIKMILEETSKTQNRFLLGLRDLQDYSKKRYGKTFQNCSLLDKMTILEYYENKDFKSEILKKIEEKLFGESFFSKFKHLTIIGFCTSKIGATEALAYDYIPVNYQACIPLIKGQKSWATK